jgi:hypothetical protein
VNVAYCVNCGDKIENQELICIGCGTNMGRLLKNHGGSVGYGSSTGALGTFLEYLKKVIKALIVTPVSSTISYSKELGLRGGAALSAAFSIIFGLTGLWIYELVFSRLLKLSENYARANVGGRLIHEADMFIKQNLETLKNLKMSHIKVFAICFLIFMLSITVMFLTSYFAGVLIFKRKEKPLELWNSFVCASAPFITGLIVSTAAAYISMALSIIIIIAGSTVALICLYHGIKEAMVLTENRAAILLPFTYAALIVTVYTYIVRLFANYVTMVTVKRFFMFLFNYYMNIGGLYF